MLTSGQLSQSSGIPSESPSAKTEVQLLVASLGQKSQASGIASASVSRLLLPAGQMSQGLPMPSLSESVCARFAVKGQLSITLGRAQLVRTNVASPTPSLSISVQVSQASPKASSSWLSWLELDTVGQLSQPSGTPSPSVSVRVEVQELVASLGQKSQAFCIPSASESRLLGPAGQISQRLPMPSLSVSIWVGFMSTGQLSKLTVEPEHVEISKPVSPNPSLSRSVQVSQASPMPSLS